MDDIVETAISQAEQEHRTVDTSREFGDPEIVAIGCGDEGISAAETINRRTGSVTTIAVGVEDSERQATADTNFSFHFDRGASEHGLGAGTEYGGGSKPTIARQLDDALNRADICFVLGRLTTPEALAAVDITAAAVDRSSAISIAASIISTAGESDERAVSSVREVLSAFDLATLIDIEQLQQKPGHSSGTPDATTTTPESLIVQFVVNAATTIIEPSLINLDYADLTSIFQKGDIGTLASISIENPDPTKIETYGRAAIQNPLYPLSQNAVEGCWIHLTGGPGLTLKTAETLANNVVNQPEVQDTAVSIWSARIVDDFEQFLQVETLLTGLQMDDSFTVSRK